MKKLLVPSMLLLSLSLIFYAGCGGDTPESLAKNHIETANSAVRVKDFKTAIEEYKTAIEIDPGNALAHYDLAYLLETEFKNYEEAIIHYRMALEHSPDQYRFLYKSIAKIYYDQEKYDDALLAYRKAVAILPNDSLAHNDYGAVLIKKGMIKEAIEEFEKAIKIDPSDETPQKNRDKAYVLLNESHEEKKE
ncbi:MAG: tetratricopeptide repeat protein [Candidatus Schekmanbacteria bacterium]|nr:tetratricopeptide repeat protein [Candidatus Schekmanbacteria bacterium]